MRKLRELMTKVSPLFHTSVITSIMGETKASILKITAGTAKRLQPNESAFFPVIPTQARDTPLSAL
jgi:hypothetical protein